MRRTRTGRRKRRRNFSASPRGLAIFQWDLLEHHSKALRPPGRAGRLPWPWHFHLVPFRPTRHSRSNPTNAREDEKGLRGRDERSLGSSHLVSSSRLVSSRLIPPRRGAGRAPQLIILFSRRARQTARAFH